MLRDSKFVKGLRSSGKQLQSFGTGMATLGAIFDAAGAAIVAPLVGAVKHFADFGSELNDMSARTGISATALAELGYAAEQSGASLEDVEGGVRKMQKFMGTAAAGSKEARKSLSDLGLAFADLDRMTPEDQFQAISAKIAAIDDPTKRAAAAMEIFGKKGTTLLPMLESLAAMREEARDLGIAPSDAAVKTADDLGDAFHRIVRAAGATAFEIGAAVAPAVLEATRVVTRLVAISTKWVKQNQGVVVTVAAIGAGLLAAGAVITGLGLSIAALGIALQGLATGIGVLGTILGAVASPLGIISVLLVAGVFAWARFTKSGQAAVNGIMGFLGPLLSTIKTTFGGIFDAIAGGDLALAGQIGMTGLRLAFLQGIASLSSEFGGKFGDFLGTIGQQLSEGNLAGVWNSVVAGMADVWATFAEGMVAVFTQAARAVTNVWQGAVTGIANWLLKKSAQGGIFGKIVSKVIGADLSQQQAEAELTRTKQMESVQKLLAQAQEDLDQTKLHGGRISDKHTGEWVTTEEMQRVVDELQKRLETLQGEVPNVLSDAQMAAGEQVAGQADALRSKLDQMDRDAQQRTRNAAANLNQQTGGGAAGANEAVAKLQAELDALRQQAAEAKRRANEHAEETRRKAGLGDEAPDMGNLQHEVVGTFSAAALAAGGAGFAPMERIARATEEMKEQLRNQYLEQKQLRRDLSRFGVLGP